MGVARLPDDSPHIYSVRRIGSFGIGLVAVLLVFGLWVQRTGDLSVALGILAAGLAFALMEIGHLLSGDHNTGRIVTVSNACIFKEPLLHYPRHLDYVWDEIASQTMAIVRFPDSSQDG